MNMRTRDPSLVRIDALKLAKQKAEEGCIECARSWISLARRYGAAESAVRAAVPRLVWAAEGPMASYSEGSNQPDQSIFVPKSPRGLWIPAGLPEVPSPEVVSHMSSTALADFRQEVSRAKKMPPKQDPYLGCDGFTGPISYFYQFYIGELGYGQCSNCGPCGGACFDTQTATAAGYAYTYGYWGLEGPGSKPGNISTNYDWGIAQGNSAVSNWQTGPYASYLGGQTIFCDVESGFTGWSSTDLTGNVDVLNGFIDAVHAASFVPGVYIKMGDIGTYFPTSYTPNNPFVFWATGNVEGYADGSTCDPCSSGCDPMTTLTSWWDAGAYHACFGGQGIVIWQFWTNPPFGCGDFDYTQQNPYATFEPIGCS